MILLIGVRVFWLYLFGDDPWPTSAQTALAGAAYGAGPRPASVCMPAVPFVWR